MGIERRARKLIAPLLACVFASACANQTPVIPMLSVQPNAGARIFYLERRAQAMFGKAEQGEAEGERGADSDAAVHAEATPEAAEARAACAPRTWGAPNSGVSNDAAKGDSAPPAERTSCDSQ